MNKTKALQIVITCLVMGCIVFFAACNDDEKGELLKHSAYQFDFEEYTVLPSESFPYINKYFTPTHAAKYYMNAWLMSRYYVVADGSTADITYDFKDYDRPEYLDKLNSELVELDLGDYAMVWGDVYANFFTPDVSSSNIPEILDVKKRTEDVEEGDYCIIAYNYSPTNATINANEKVVYFSDNFNSIPGANWDEFDYEGWYNKETSGVGLKWRLRIAGEDRIPTAYSRGKSGSNSWLINRNGVDLRYAKNPMLTFGYGMGYYDESQPNESFDCMTMYVTNKLDAMDPTISKWTDVSETAGIRSITPVTGYPGRSPLKLDLKKYVGDYFHLGFNYNLPKRNDPYTLAPLYYVDNIDVYEMRDVAKVDAKEVVYDVFTYTNNKWESVSDLYYVLQAEDYLQLNVLSMSPQEALSLIPPFLDTKFPAASAQDKIIVVYKINETHMGASEFTFDGTVWSEAGSDITKKTDRYTYTKELGWQYQPIEKK